MVETKGVAILAFSYGIHQRLKTNKQTFANTKKWQPFEGPLNSIKKTIDHILPIIIVVMVSNFPLLNAFLIWEVLYNIFKHFANIYTTSGKWVLPLWSLNFINTKIDKHLSSSMLPTTCTITNSTNFTYWGKLVIRMRNVVTSCYNLMKWLVSNKGRHACHCISFHCQFEQSLLAFKVPCIKELEDFSLLSIQGGSPATTKCSFKNLYVFLKRHINI